MVAAKLSRTFPGMDRPPKRFGAGVLAYQHILDLKNTGHLFPTDPVDEIELSQLQPSSMDLRLGATAIQVRASFLPGKKLAVVDVARGLEIQTLDLTSPQVLQTGAVYIIPLLETLKLPPTVMAKANPKSTTGRLDVFARLITDYADQFDSVRRGYEGPLFVEVAPKTFNVSVSRGTKLNQLRFVTGVAPHSDASQKAKSGETLVYGDDGEPLHATVSRGLWLTVDLKDEKRERIVGWKALHNAPPIEFDRVAYYDPMHFWEPVYANADSRLILNPKDFYLLGSKERVRIPPSFAAEMVPYDPGMGEFRVHYAGFFDPGFGYGSGDIRGTRAILEVRSYDVPYVLRTASTSLASSMSGYWNRLIGSMERSTALPINISSPASGSNSGNPTSSSMESTARVRQHSGPTT